MRKLITLTTVTSLLLCVSTSNFASNLTEPASVDHWLWSVAAPADVQSVAEPVSPPTAVLPAQDETPAPLTVLTQKFEQFVIDYNQLQEQSKLRLDLLEDENASLKSKVRLLDKQVAHLQEQQEAHSGGLLQQNWLVLGLSFGLIAWLLALTLRGRQQRPAAVATERVAPHIHSPEADLEDEYDYLGSEEGIAAKLDLARAYVDMGDIEQARQALEDVLKVGNATQQQTARELLDQLEEEMVH